MINYKKIEMIISDIDGVWTDGSIYRGTDDMEFKKFSVFDGVGVAYARAADLKIAIISARYSPATEFRAKELKIDDCYNGGLNKLHAYSDLKKKYSLSDDQIAYLGDDMVDLPVMELVGLPIAVANATPDIMRVAKHTTETKGGEGAFREAVEWIIKKQNRTEEVKEAMIRRVLKS
ncbi:HAD hydrolase family protein [bacterium]|jgi:3-deoxy-D-manno-octulosonate 8-phosphate phosphatase (KDO 8-P phosphatase)|nr:HAD hydrolase family protein [bacterium]MBT4249095.1 HAD hydrolase family protein [bacterium]MBT6018946.1 HAD hydrolase family protein [bacterium]MBT6777796.1 HAD hydrolase family protein [bacterium]